MADIRDFIAGHEVGEIISADAAPSANYLQRAGVAVLKSAYPALATVYATDPFQFEASSFLTTRASLYLAPDILNANRENQLGYGGGNVWHLAGEGSLYYSSDSGLTWSYSGIPGVGGYSVNGIIYAASLGLYIAYGGHTTLGRQVWTSPDLVTWTNRHSDGSGALGFAHGVWNGTAAVLATAGAAIGDLIFRSTNGTSWAAVSGPTSSADNVPYIGWFPDFSLLVLLKTSNSTHDLMTSADNGVTWVDRVNIAKATYGAARKVVQVGNRLVAFGLQNAITADTTLRYTTGSDGASWSYSTLSGGNPNLYDAASNGRVTIFTNYTGGKLYAMRRFGGEYPTLQDVTPTAATFSYASSANSLLQPARVYWTGVMFMAIFSYSNVGNVWCSYTGEAGTWFNMFSGPNWAQFIAVGARIIGVEASGPSIRTTMPIYNTANYFWLPHRSQNDTPTFVRAK